MLLLYINARMYSLLQSTESGGCVEMPGVMLTLWILQHPAQLLEVPRHSATQWYLEAILDGLLARRFMSSMRVLLAFSFWVFFFINKHRRNKKPSWEDFICSSKRTTATKQLQVKAAAPDQLMATVMEGWHSIPHERCWLSKELRSLKDES